jgi:hypothetical protein
MAAPVDRLLVQTKKSVIRKIFVDLENVLLWGNASSKAQSPFDWMFKETHDSGRRPLAHSANNTDAIV